MLMCEWREARLGDLGEVNRGRSRHRPRNAPHLYGGPYPFIQTGDIKAANGLVTSHSQTYTEAGLAQSRLWPEGTMVVTIAANIAETAILTYPACFPDSVVGFIANPSVADVRFVEYLFRHHKQQIQHENVGTGSVQDNINLQTFDRLTLRVPGLVEQNRIVAVLGALDDKIELNRRMNETLEAMAWAIFKDWFVDFGPTRAKAEGRAPYLAPELWDLFPNGLDDEDKPIGWCHWALADLATHHRPTVSPSAEPKRVFEHYSIPAFDAGQEPALDAGSSIKSNKTTVPVNAVLLSKLNPDIPRVWIPNPPDDRPQVASTEFLAFTPKPPANRSVLYCLFRDNDFRREMEAMVTGTSKSHQRVSPKALVKRQVLCGANDLFEQFDKRASPLLSRVLKNRQESSTLAQMRDLLLPKLMSGEIRLTVAEKAAEAVA